MRKRLLILPVIFFVFSLVLISCKYAEDKSRKSLEFIKSLKSYSCDCTIALENDRQILEYNCKQYYNRKLGGRIEIDENRILTYKNDKIYVRDLKSGIKYTLDKDFDTIFKISMIGECVHLMYTNEEIKTFVKDIDGIEYTIVELSIPGMNRNLSKGKLYINNRDNLPEKLEILDFKSREKVRVTYKNFNANAELNDKLFNED
ncbi:germination lipoprotein GerS-related protein [Clostridium lundense]|uniref:germination lipoprotein GerS-related protein n=1 Tax=Clostridium lundense TaxID=319475 RepID=UPI00048054E1|nr:germination lipoprotein GerS-related protein [Clostridium lundense]